MTLIERIAKIEGKFRKHILRLPSPAVVFLYSNSRKFFLKSLVSDLDFPVQEVHENLSFSSIGLKFRSPLMNAAGMFKNGDGYYLAFQQGAGAFLAGTTTSEARKGNTKGLLVHPFISYNSSASASNWMGLPNEGHASIAKKLAKIDKIKDFPLGASIAASAGQTENQILDGIIEGLNLYSQAGVDFIELNESCPNITGHSKVINDLLSPDLTARLVYISEKFLKKRNRNIPVILKLSNDTATASIPPLLDLIIQLGFDGVNFGNTSTQYDYYRKLISQSDLVNYDYFTSEFGGGLSGKILKESSLSLAKSAIDYIEKKNLNKEFLIIRTGGVSNFKDLVESKNNKIKMNQWFSGYFDSFARRGHNCYNWIYKHIATIY